MCDRKTIHNIYQSIKIENHINDINDLSEIINQKKVYENKIIMTEYEIEYLSQSIIKLIQNIQEIKIDTNYIDKYKNGYFLENTIEYELIDNIKTGMEVYLLSDLKIKKHVNWPKLSFDVFNDNNCEMYVDYKKVPFSKSFIIKENLKPFIQYKIKDNFKLTDCRCMFAELDFIKKIKFNKLNMHDVTEIYAMFRICENLESIEGMEDWDVSHIKNMWCVFSGCANLYSIKGLENWDISNVTNISGIFEFNNKIKSLDNIGSWDTRNITTMWNTFSCCPNLVCIKGIKNWNLQSLSDNKNPFEGSPKLNDEVKNSNLYKEYYN